MSAPNASPGATRTAQQISRNMAAVRSRNTRPELMLRHALWHRGLRYRIHYRTLPGTPDIAFPAAKVAVFCDGAFWHGRDIAETERQLHSNRDFWLEKIRSNIRRDREVNDLLIAQGWRVIRLWDTDIKKGAECCADTVERLVRGKSR